MSTPGQHAGRPESNRNPASGQPNPAGRGDDEQPSFSPHDAQPGSAGGGMSMGGMAAALPNVRPGQAVPVGSSVHRMPPGAVPPNLTSPQQHQMHPFSGQAHQGPQSPPYAQSFHQQPFLPQSNYYMQPGGGQAQAPHPASFQQSYPSGPFYGAPQQQSPGYNMYYPQAYGQMNLAQQFQGSVQSPGGMGGGGGVYPPGAYGAPGSGHGGTPRGPGSATGSRHGTSPTKGAIPSAPRGPPRKPKQSGHALWVGNLPPGAQVQDLKDHFARDATKDIESVFLISKSNCAFVNYRTEVACAAAMTRFHDSRFRGVRLVCRYRSAATGTSSAAAPTGPAALSPVAQQSQTAVDAIAQNREVSSKAEESMRSLEGATKIMDKYFIVKSLTVEDLELSARNGIWATQGHNEDALNKAFESVENVFLIFSANKSGEYFGYARMASPIDEESASKLDWKPRTEAVVDDPKLPRAIPTPATDTAPPGRIIDDSARGTIFWEVEASEEEEEDEKLMDAADAADKADATDKADASPADEDSGPQTFGRPFKIEWISTNRLPFYRTRGLRNPWNANRDVKIARDGTELETSVGRRLVQMFHRSATPTSQQQQQQQQQMMPPGSPSLRGGAIGHSNLQPF